MIGMRYQPQAGVRINWSNPITRGLVYATTPTKVRSVAEKPTPYGIAAQTPTMIPEYVDRPGFTNIPEMTIMGVSMRTNILQNSGQYLVRIRGQGNTNGNCFSIGVNPYSSGRDVSVSIQYSDYTSANVTYNLPTAPSGQRLIGIGTHSLSTLQMNLWLDGVKVATTSASNKNLWTSTATAYLGDAAAGNLNTAAPNLMCAMWLRTLSDDEIKSLSDNPWQIFLAPEDDLEVLVASVPNTPRRALIRSNNNIIEIVDVLVGTGQKPLVLLNGLVKERVAAEGLPIIMVDGRLRTLAADETLLI